MSADATTLASGDTITLSFALEHFELTGGHDDHDGHERSGNVGVNDFAAEFEPLYEGDEHGEASGDDRKGHVHVYLDDLMTEPLVQAVTREVEVTIDAAPGPHKLMGRLHASDHRIIEPQVISTVDITVE